ncbi:MAG: hypothetical protein ABI410_06035 [Rhodoferax sp.]|uniref:hypothetical protein n=1 Tax=Rhodoferax sp. TaxID=50421 RepID=UPI00326745E4
MKKANKQTELKTVRTLPMEIRTRHEVFAEAGRFLQVRTNEITAATMATDKHSFPNMESELFGTPPPLPLTPMPAASM